MDRDELTPPVPHLRAARILALGTAESLLRLYAGLHEGDGWPLHETLATDAEVRRMEWAMLDLADQLAARRLRLEGDGA